MAKERQKSRLKVQKSPQNVKSGHTVGNACLSWLRQLGWQQQQGITASGKTRQAHRHLTQPLYSLMSVEFAADFDPKNIIKINHSISIISKKLKRS